MHVYSPEIPKAEYSLIKMGKFEHLITFNRLRRVFYNEKLKTWSTSKSVGLCCLTRMLEKIVLATSQLRKIEQRLGRGDGTQHTPTDAEFLF